MSYIVKVKETESGEIVPLSAPIEDKNRAMLIYNMAMYMGQNHNHFMVPDPTDDYPDPELINRISVEMTKDNVMLVDDAGNRIEPVMDKEWFGTEEDNEAVKEEVFQKHKQKVIAKNGEEAWGEDIERQIQKPYTICSYDYEQHNRVWFAPETWDFDKANEMYNAIKYGMADRVEIMFTYEPYGEDDYTIVDPDDVAVVNKYGDVLQEDKNENWAKETVSEESEITLTDEDLKGLGEADDMSL